MRGEPFGFQHQGPPTRSSSGSSFSSKKFVDEAHRKGRPSKIESERMIWEPYACLNICENRHSLPRHLRATKSPFCRLGKTLFEESRTCLQPERRASWRRKRPTLPGLSLFEEEEAAEARLRNFPCCSPRACVCSSPSQRGDVRGEGLVVAEPPRLNGAIFSTPSQAPAAKAEPLGEQATLNTSPLWSNEAKSFPV